MRIAIALIIFVVVGLVEGQIALAEGWIFQEVNDGRTQYAENGKHGAMQEKIGRAVVMVALGLTDWPVWQLCEWRVTLDHHYEGSCKDVRIVKPKKVAP